MKQINKFCLLSLVLCAVTAQAESTYLYQQELNDFKNSPRYQVIFNKDANDSLRCIQRDIENYKKLSMFQRAIRFAFLSLDSVVLTKDTMPKLYSYIDSMCEEHRIKTPTIFITRQKDGFFNAFAQKLLVSSGAIVIGHQLLLETNDAELEAIVAHEIGHIKHNHANKTLLILIATAIASKVAIDAMSTPHIDPVMMSQDKQLVSALYKGYLPVYIASILTPLIINKRFEKEADEFAYKSMNKGEGLIEFFQDLQQREANDDKSFIDTYEILQESKPKLAWYDTPDLTMRYYLASLGHKIDKVSKWIYYNTPLGAHPSHEARIEVAQEYLASNM